MGLISSAKKIAYLGFSPSDEVMLNPLRFREATARSLKDVISTPPEKQWAGMPKYCAAVWAQI